MNWTTFFDHFIKHFERTLYPHDCQYPQLTATSSHSSILKMHISYLALLFASFFVTHSNICFANPLFSAEVAPRSTLLVNPSPNNENDLAEPICFGPSGPSAQMTSSDDLGAYGTDCLAAANSLFGIPMVSQVRWHWKRKRAGQPPQRGYNYLPLAAAPGICMIRLDVLSDPDAEDQFALVETANDFRRLYNKCVQPNPRIISPGYVPVGPRKVLKLEIKLTPPVASLGDGGLIVNGTELPNDISQS